MKEPNTRRSARPATQVPVGAHSRAVDDADDLRTIAGEPYRGSFVGRVREQAHITSLLETGGRLVTLRGLGGVGKTRLALRLFHEQQATGRGPRSNMGPLGFENAWFCELASARTPRDVLWAIASSAFGLALGSRSTDEAVRKKVERGFAASGKALLVVDNLEQLESDAVCLVETWLRAAPTLAIIATSRVKLGLAGEQVIELEPLAVDAAEGDSDALTLLYDRARSSGVQLTPADRAACQQLVLLLEGLPLAIEMASARLSVLSPAELVERLARPRAREQLLVLPTARGDAERHQSLARVLGDSWDLLNDRERSVLAATGVFVGGFDLRALEAVTELDDAAAILERLIDHSLIRRVRSATSGLRFFSYEVVREFAVENLRASGQLSRLQGRHADYFASYRPHDIAGLALEGPNLGRALEHLQAEPIGARYLEALLKISPLKMLRGPLDVWVVELEQALSALDSSVRSAHGCLVSELELALARALHELGRTDQARAAYLQAMGSAARLEAWGLRATAQVQLGRLTAGTGAWAEGCEHFEAVANDVRSGADVQKLARACLEFYGTEIGRSKHPTQAVSDYLEVCRQGHDPRETSFWLVQLGRLESELTRRSERALASFDEALAISRSIADGYGEGFVYFARGVHLVGHYEPEPAKHDLARSAELLREAGTLRYLGWTQGFAGIARMLLGEYREADEFLTMAIEILRGVHDSPRLSHFLAFRGAARALAAQRSLAASDFSEARLVLRTSTDYHTWTHRLCEAQLIVLDAREAEQQARGQAQEMGQEVRGEVDVAARLAAAVDLLAQLDWPASGYPEARDTWPWQNEFFEPRLAAGILAEAVRAAKNQQRVMSVARDGSSFRAPSGEVVRCPGRGSLQRLLVALAEARIARSGAPLSAKDLAKHGWPDERTFHDSLQNRLHVALDTLRKLGLRPFIEHTEGGWRFDPSVNVVWVENGQKNAG